LLLASYLDGHDDVIMLPLILSHAIYPFFDRYRTLSLRDKLITYPFCAFEQVDNCRFFFQGEHRISPADYYAAVNALFDVCGKWPLEILESRRTFFQFIHVVYCVALGRRLASPRPLIVYAQHSVSDRLATWLVEDFPQANFIHTVRDPITNCGRLFDFYLTFRGFFPAVYVIAHLTSADMPNPGMESRTLTIRFEDLHSHLEETMNAVAGWLGLPYQSSLLDSTFNGVPYVTQRGATIWSGVRPLQAIRDSGNISFSDRCLLFAVLYDDFAAWKYPCPKIFKYALIRVLTFMLVLLVPMKMEIIGARAILKSPPSTGFRSAIKGGMRICIVRVAIMSLLAVELYRRLVFGKQILELQQSGVTADAGQ
jgi:hypothetical protein